MYVSVWFHYLSWEAIATKVSSGQGIVKPPMVWSNPNSSSALLNRDWKEGWFKNETGTIYLFFWLSPTYTARNPFGVEAALLVRIFFAAKRLLIIAISDSKVWWSFGIVVDYDLVSFCVEKLVLLCVYINQWSEALIEDYSVAYKM